MIKTGESLRCRFRQRRFGLRSLAVALQASLRTVPDELNRVLELRSPFRYTILNSTAKRGIGCVPSNKALSAITHNPNRR